ncbi:MAG: TonB family protein [Smithellaceae bacterium]|nr:TonB family protein [Smithellaceae bacterium]NLX52511.1 energy transducer TonB [Deltaproteobacteria bacterium]
MMEDRREKLLGIGASLGLHALAAGVLLLGLSGAVSVSRDIRPLEMVWVSLSAAQTAASRTAAPRTVAAVRKAVKTPPASVPTTALAAAETPSAQTVRPEIQAATPAAQKAEVGSTTARDGSGIVAFAAAGLPGTASDAGRAQAPAVAPVPAFANAYPLYRENPPPAYPAVARQMGYQGVVYVQAEILTDGRVGRTMIRKSSGYAILDRTALKAVRRWKFEPAKKSGVPCATWAELPIKFVIDEQHSQS